VSTSLHNGIVEFAASLYGTDDDPVENSIVRDGLANGLLHAADSMAQVRVNYFPILSAAANGQDTFETVESSPTTGTWYRVGGSPFGEWPLTLHADGTPYKLRVRIGVSASSSTASTQLVRVVIAPNSHAVLERDLSADNVYQISFASGTVGTTPTWVAGTSQGDAASATLITVDADTARSWTRDVQVYDAVSSATPRDTMQCLVAAHVYALTSNASVQARLYALHIAEYVGA
jgi:hypothetical protein